ncbi:hypothetical protein ACHAQA_008232 [Verticillium albo-atrum]
MADDDQSLSYEEHNAWFSFRAYITVAGVTRESVIAHLRHPDADDDENVLTEIRLGETTQSLIQYHRENTPIRRDSDIHPRLFIIVDSADVQERGVMLVALQEYHGYNDAVRGPIEDVRDQLLSMAIGNDEWWTMKQIGNDDNPKAVPIKWFTAYNLHPNEETFETAFRKLNDGLYDVHVLEDEDYMAMAIAATGATDGTDGTEDNAASEGSIGSPAEGENADNQMINSENGEQVEEEEELVQEEEDPENVNDFYKAFKPEVRSLDEVMDGHAAQAQENTQDPDMFAVIDEEYETQGVLIVRVSPEKDLFRCKGEVAGEILKWVFINFKTWDEVKAFARAQG